MPQLNYSFGRFSSCRAFYIWTLLVGYGMLLVVAIISRRINTWNLLQGFQLSKLFSSLSNLSIFHCFVVYFVSSCVLWMRVLVWPPVWSVILTCCDFQMFFITAGNELQQYSLKSLGDVYLAIFWVKIIISGLCCRSWYGHVFLCEKWLEFKFIVAEKKKKKKTGQGLEL